MGFLDNRIPPPIVMAIFGLGMYGLAQFLQNIGMSDAARYALTIGFVLFAAIMLIGGAVSFRLAKTTVNPLKPEQASSLVTGGVYRVSRNPMYVGFASLLIAWASYLGSAWSLILVVGYVCYIQHFQIKPEERAMLKLFGQEFEEYKERVRAWL